MATSLFVPVAYITVLVTAMAIFSRVYRRRRAGALAPFLLIMVANYFTSFSLQDINRTMVF